MHRRGPRGGRGTRRERVPRRGRRAAAPQENGCHTRSGEGTPARMTFIDTGILFATAVRRDARHTRARRLLEALAPDRPFTTDHVLVETWMMIRLRVGWQAAMRFLGSL